MNYTPTVTVCNNGINFNYVRWHSGSNPEDSGRYWQYENVWFVRIGFRPKPLMVIERVTDKQRYKGIVILGLELGKGYFYQEERIL